MHQPSRSFGTVLAFALLAAACGSSEPSLASRDVAHDEHARHDHAMHGTHANDTGGSTRLTVRTEGERIVLEIGPVDLPAVPDGSMLQTPLLETAIPVDAMLTGFDVRVVDGSGNALPQSLLHHVNVMLPERRDLFRPVMQRLVAAGSETSSIRLPWPFAVRVAAGEPVLAYAMLHSDAPVAEGPVTLQLHLRHDGAGRHRAVQPFFIDASPPPGPGGWDLPPGRSERSWEGRPAVDGRILGVGGHLHQYGTELMLEDVTEGRVLVRLRPQLENGELVGIERRRFLWRLGLPLRREHTYRITAYYDNPTGRVIPDGAMGSIAGMMTVGDPWPGADRNHPSYGLDMEWLSGVHGHAHGQHQ